jgi:hypothetical protein
MHGAVYFSYKGQIFSGKDLFLTRIAFFLFVGRKKKVKRFSRKEQVELNGEEGDMC